MSSRARLSPRPWSPVPTLRGALAALSCLACLAAGTAAAQAPAIQFKAEVPTPPAQMQVYKLTPTAAPLAFVNEKLAAARLPALSAEGTTHVSRAANVKDSNDAVRAFLDSKSGVTSFSPSMADLTVKAEPARALTPQQHLTIAASALADTRFIPKDATTLKTASPVIVTGSSGIRRVGNAGGTASQTPQKTMFTITTAIRYAGGYQVYGRGSHAAISTANDGTIIGAVRSWHTATAGDRIQPAMTAAQVKADIQRQVQPYVTSARTSGSIDTIELAYYDANGSYLQPVYRFIATVKTSAKTLPDSHLVGYVAVGKPLEAIPDLVPKVTIRPATPPQTGAAPPSAGGIGSASISVGEYPNQSWQTDSGYCSMSEAFLSGLQSNTNPSLPKFARTQYYVAYPFEVNGASSKNYLNAVNIAYTVPHGNWWLNTTLSNYGDEWYIQSINPGFGAATGGKLAAWILASCENIPSCYDKQNQAGGNGGTTAFDPWWQVFQGLHHVIGYRTEMLYPDDGVFSDFGALAAQGGDICYAWFTTMANHYPSTPENTYNDSNLTGNPLVHWDRGCTVVDSRCLGQSIYNVSPQTTASTTLWMFWMGN